MKDSVLYIAIDPGKTGFISFGFEGNYSFESIPINKDTKDIAFRQLYQSISDKITDLVMNVGVEQIKVAIEQVNGRAGWSATNTFNFGYAAGALRQLMACFTQDENVFMVRPAKWQSFVRRGYPDLKKASSTGKTQVRDPKAVAKMIVEKEFPDIDFRKSTRARKVDDNKIDSFLILQYLIKNDK